MKESRDGKFTVTIDSPIDSGREYHNPMFTPVDGQPFKLHTKLGDMVKFTKPEDDSYNFVYYVALTGFKSLNHTNK